MPIKSWKRVRLEFGRPRTYVQENLLATTAKVSQMIQWEGSVREIILKLTIVTSKGGVTSEFTTRI